MTRVAGAVLAAGLAGLAAPASAGAGNGIRFGGGDARLHPFLDLEARYDSNVRFSGTTELSDLILHVRPGVKFTAPGDVAAVEFSGAIDWAQYLGIDDTNTKDLSTLFAEANLGLKFNQRGQIGLELDDQFRRRDGSTALSVSSAVVSNYNALAVDVPIQPGGGALLLKLGGGWVLESFECPSGVDGCDSTAVSNLGYDQVSGRGQLRWRFLPRTAAVLEGEYFKQLPNDDTVGVDVGGVRVLAGVAGLITTHIAGHLKAGWGDTTGDRGGDPALLARVELEWIPTELTDVVIGYVRDVGAEPQTTFTSDRGYAEARTIVGGRLTFKVAGSYSALDYPGAVSAKLLRAEPGVDLEVARWLKVGIAYAYTKRTASGGTSTAPGFEFTKNEAWLRASLTY